MKQLLIFGAALLGVQLTILAAAPNKLINIPGDQQKGPSRALLTTAAHPLTLDIWPGKAPGEIEQLPPEIDKTKPEDRLIAGRRIIKLGNVSVPQITLFKPAPAIDTGTSVIIAPGGGHHILAYDLEGTEVAEWLNSMGVTGIVLKYRVPGRNPEQRWKAAVQDAQRTVSLVRSRSEEFGLDPDKIGLMGFSAGAQTSALATLLQSRQYAPVDGHDQYSFIPNFVGLIYLGGGVLEAEGIHIHPDLPPFFLAIAHDDKDRSIESAQLYIALKKAEVSSELHIYESGGHGYGLRPTDLPVTRWNEVMGAWLKQIGFLN